MTTSVALCTYNGASYIQEQIESILNQTMPVDEIVICDDGSTDDTVSIIQQISSSIPEKIRLIKNPTNLGLCANFINAISLCKGDIIFLSDQDDVWHNNKVEKLTHYLIQHPKIDLAFSDATLMGGRFDGQRMSDKLNFPKENRKMFLAGLAFELSLYQVYALGASMAVRKKFIDQIIRKKPILNSHDHFLQLEASARDAIAYLDEPLYDYRIHKNQTSNAGENMANILNYITIPQNGEVWPLQEIASTITDNRLIKRVQYMNERNHILHDIWGPLKVILRPLLYWKLYQKKSFSVMKYDFLRSLKHTLIRIKLKHNATSLSL